MINEPDKRSWRNRRVLLLLVGVIAMPTALVCYSVPLYRLFCQATGLGGTTRRASTVADSILDRTVDVRFTTSVEPGLPWRFVPQQKVLRVHLGEEAMAYFQAENLSSEPITGHATFNVMPAKTGPYFVKLQCFCFNEERLEPGVKVQMPVLFFVDPRLATDRNDDDLTTITLSYTFFRSLDASVGKDMSRLDVASQPADFDHGRRLFAQDCASCHVLNRGGAGPTLAGIVGRRAGEAPDYRYSDAVRAADLIWTAGTLDTWLANPSQLIPGTRMPVAVPIAQDRRDLIAFLASLGTPSAAGASQIAKPHS